MAIGAYVIKACIGLAVVSLLGDVQAQTFEAKIYEDGEDGLTTGWSIYDNSPKGALIKNVHDADKGSRVIVLQGSGLDNGFVLGGLRGVAQWRNNRDRILSWSMEATKDFAIYVTAQTPKRRWYLKYTPSDIDLGMKNKGEIHHGLGRSAKDGRWHTFTRDLEADLKEYVPTAEITTIDAFLVRGSGAFDDIRLSSPEREGKILDKRIPNWNPGEEYPRVTKLSPVFTRQDVSRPGYLQSIIDLEFGAKVTRVTDLDVFSEFEVIDGIRERHAIVGYPKIQHWNADGSLIRLTYTLLDGHDYHVVLPDIRRRGESGDRRYALKEMRWSNVDPKILYGMDHSGASHKFVAQNVKAGDRPPALIAEFPKAKYQWVFLGPWEGNLTLNDRYAVFAARKVQENHLTAIVYDLYERSVVIEKDLPNILFTHSSDPLFEPYNLDWISVSPLGNYILVKWHADPNSANPSKVQSVDQYDLNLNYIRTLADEGGHGDIGLNRFGEEVYVQFEYSPDARGIWLYKLSDGTRVKLLPDTYGGGHVSCQNYNRPGWCYISFNHETNGYMEVLAVNLDSREGLVNRFVQTHASRKYKSYGTPNRDGTKVLFRSNRWGGISNADTFLAEGP